MTQAVYTISFLEMKGAEPACFDNQKDCADEVVAILSNDEKAPFFVIKTTNTDGDLTHETVSDDFFELACEAHIEECAYADDVENFAIGCPSYEDRFGGYAPAHADRADLAA